MNPRSVAIKGEDGKYARAEVHTSSEKIRDALCAARGNRVHLITGFQFPQDVYKHDFHRQFKNMGPVMKEKLGDGKALTITPSMKMNPRFNNDPSAPVTEDLCMLELSESPETIDVSKIMEALFTAAWYGQNDNFTAPCESLLHFIVFVNHVIQSAKSTNHLLILATFVYYDTTANAVYLCFVEQNVVKIAQYVTPENEKDLFLVSAISRLTRENLEMQLEIEKLGAQNDDLRGKPWADYIRRVFEENKESISSAVNIAFVQPLVTAVNDQIVKPNVERLSSHKTSSS